jgi:hypothetical protein
MRGTCDIFITISLLVRSTSFPLPPPPRNDQHDLVDLMEAERKLIEAGGKSQQYLLRVNGKLARVTVHTQTELVAAADTFGRDSGTVAAPAQARVDRDNAAAVLFSFWSMASIAMFILPAAYCAFRILNKKETPGDIETETSEARSQNPESGED